jgi:alkyldihydroxyacetonephosphate synthase
MILGSEGTLGVVTEAILKLRPLPEMKRFGSLVFPDFETGVAFMREVAKQRIAPASIRLVDSMQFQFSQVLKPAPHSKVEEILDSAKKWYVTRYKGYDVNKMVAATLVFEGTSAEVELQQKRIYALAAQYSGLPGGEEAGRRGYFLTYMIAYLRDFGFNYYVVSESFETSVPWANVLDVCYKTKERVINSCKEKGIMQKPFVSCRVTQVSTPLLWFVDLL